MGDDAEKIREEEEDDMEEVEEEDGGGEQEADWRCQLFVRFPCLVPPVDEIKALHPDIVSVNLRKQKKPKFCYLVFSSQEKAKKAMEELSSRPYKNLGHLNIQLKDNPNNLHRGKNVSGDQKKKWLIIYGVPPTEPDANVREEFQRFGCTHAHVHRKDYNDVLTKGSAKLIFNTVKDSEAFINNKDLHKYKGSPIEVKFLKTGPSKGQKKKQRRKEKQQQFRNKFQSST